MVHMPRLVRGQLVPFLGLQSRQLCMGNNLLGGVTVEGGLFAGGAVGNVDKITGKSMGKGPMEPEQTDKLAEEWERIQVAWEKNMREDGAAWAGFGRCQVWPVAGGPSLGQVGVAKRARFELGDWALAGPEFGLTIGSMGIETYGPCFGLLVWASSLPKYITKITTK